MARIANHVIPMVDPDMGELEEVAADRGLTVTINSTAASRGWPAIELHRHPDDAVRAVFRWASQAIEWLQSEGVSQ